jgi:hypothetical protein
MITITIEQLGWDGEVDRTFTRHVWPHEVDQALEDISRGFNMDHTRVTVGEDYLSGHGLNSGPNTAGIIADQPVIVISAAGHIGARGYRTSYDPPEPGREYIRLASGLLLALTPDQYRADTEVVCTCARCGSPGFSVHYDPIAQGEHVECAVCGEVRLR